MKDTPVPKNKTSRRPSLLFYMMFTQTKEKANIISSAFIAQKIKTPAGVAFLKPAITDTIA